MRKILFMMVCLLSIAWQTQAQNTKADRVKFIRQAYAQAKQKIAQNGKNGKAPKDIQITFTDEVSREPDIQSEQHLNIYFDSEERKDEGGLTYTYRQPYFVTDNWYAAGHSKESEHLFNVADGKLMFCFDKTETDGGYIMEQRYYYDKQGKLIERIGKQGMYDQKLTEDNNPDHNNAGLVEENGRIYQDIFNRIACRVQYGEEIVYGNNKATPKAERMKFIRNTYAKAKEMIALNDKSDAPHYLQIVLHDELENDGRPIKTEYNFYFNSNEGDNHCYFITMHRTYMGFDCYVEYLFNPQNHDLIFSYTSSKEEDNHWEWRYYLDENGHCIEQKTTADMDDAMDEGYEDRQEAQNLIKVFNALANPTE